MSRFISVFILITLCTLGLSKASIVSPYNFPYQNPLIATLTNVIARSTDIQFTVENLNIIPERNTVPLYEDRAYLQYTHALQSGKAPLVFVMPGLGGVATSSSAKYLAEKLYKEGYHVVTLTNPFTWQFALAASTSGTVGYAPDDARDLYKVMKTIFESLTETHQLEVTNFGFTAYSLGGLQTPFLAKIDSEEQFFNFKRFLIINPPYNFVESIRKLDEFFDGGRNFSESEKEEILLQVGTVIYQKENESVDYDYFLGLDHLLPFTDSQLKWVISASFRDTLEDVILVSQQIQDRGILQNPATEDSIEARLDEIRTYSFESYMNLFVVPFLPPPSDGQSLLDNTDLRSLNPFMKTNSKIYFMHNLDDFLMSPEYIPEIEETFGTRARLYPHGGHVGNLWFPANDWDIKMIFSTLKDD